MHQLQVIIRAIEELHAYLANKMHDVIETTVLIQNTPLVDKLNHRQMALLEHALKHPGGFYQIREHQNFHNITYETARADLRTMADILGLLVRIKRGRRIIFIAPADLKNRLQALQQ